jgi:hypothetical protein
MNRAIPRHSSSIVVTFEPACHARRFVTSSGERGKDARWRNPIPWAPVRERQAVTLLQTGEALGFVEPCVRGTDNDFPGGDTSGEDRREQRVTVKLGRGSAPGCTAGGATAVAG